MSRQISGMETWKKLSTCSNMRDTLINEMKIKYACYRNHFKDVNKVLGNGINSLISIYCHVDLVEQL